MAAFDESKQPHFAKRKNNPEATMIYGGGFVMMENELSLYNLLGYHTDPDMKVSPMTIDVYRRLKQHRMNDETNPMYGKAWVSMERLSIELAINRKTISKHLRILENIGLIVIHRFYRGGRKHCAFSFCDLLTEEEFKETYPEIIEIYEQKLKESEKDSDIEPWYNPNKENKE